MSTVGAATFPCQGAVDVTPNASPDPKPRVLIVADYYLPGFRAGGPIRSISNCISRLLPFVDFFVVTRNCDADRVAYKEIQPDTWTNGPSGRVYYATFLNMRVVQRCAREMNCDVIWLNSLFSLVSLGVLIARRLDAIDLPLIVSPRGELSPGALSLKRVRKQLAMRGLTACGCLGEVEWLASSDLEREEIRTVIGPRDPITLVPEAVSEPARGPRSWPAKHQGRLRAVFASRISPKKNLHYLIDTLAGCRESIHLDVIGPIDDPAYWDSCRVKMMQLPSNISIEHVGELQHTALTRRLAEYDVMILPTLSENFGHIVVESWAAGCPVLLSDQTPWRNLAHLGIGLDLPLADPAKWRAAITDLVHIDNEAELAMRQRCVAQAEHVWHAGLEGGRILKDLFASTACTRRSLARRNPKCLS